MTNPSETASQPAADNVDSFTVLELLTLLLRRKRVIAAITLAAAILVAAMALMTPNKYKAAAMILPPGAPSTGSAQLSQLASSSLISAGGGLVSKNPAEMYVSLLRSRNVEEGVIQRFGLMARYHRKNMVDARQSWEKHCSATLGVKDGLIRIEVSDRDPKLAADLANGTVEELRHLVSTLAITEASQRRRFFEQQLVDIRGKLAAADEAMKQTEQSTGVLHIDTQTRALIDSAASLRAELVAKRVQLESMRSYATDDNPEVKLVRQQIAALETQLAKLAGPDSGSGGELILPRGKAPAADMEYIRKLRDVRYYETISELIARQLETARLDEARQGAVIQVVDAATVPDRKSSPHRTSMVILAALLAFLAACLGCFAAERWRQIGEHPEGRKHLEALRAALR
jgi:uncharacterized protein involved in exopolysaccharide biosynthesis